VIRTTTSSDATAIRRVLAEAFVSDPMLRWIFPDDGNILRAIATVTPTGRFAYLHLLAVRPTRQRQGLGRMVVEPGLAFADGAGLGVHLETTNPENLGFYQSLGFVVSNQLAFDADGPALWAMWRQPR
jgi:predicted N-acetyltransferase YhbS